MMLLLSLLVLLVPVLPVSTVAACALTNPYPCEKPFEEETATGGWTVFQRRCNGCVPFNRNWAEYKAGFGYPGEEIWLGLDNLHAMTSQQPSELRIDLQLFNGKKGFAVYSNFSVGPSGGNYTLNFAAMTSGNLNNALQYNNGMPFTTNGECARYFMSGWWFKINFGCGEVYLNGLYGTDATCLEEGLCPFWVGFEIRHPMEYVDPIKTIEMRFRPMSP